MLIINARIITMEKKDFGNGYILTKENKIFDIGDMKNINLDAYKLEETINAEGLTAYPGFIDPHCHMGMWDDGLDFEGDDGNEITDPVSPQLRAIDAINPNNISFKEAYENGITTVVTGPGSANVICGQFCAIKTYGKRVDDMIVKAPVSMKFAFGENPKNCYNDKDETPMTRMATASLIREALEKAKRYNESIEKAKKDSDYDMPEYEAKYEALIPLFNHKLKAHIHAHRRDDIFTAIRIMKEFDINYSLVHCTEGYLIADILEKEKCEVISGPIISTRTKPELRYASPENPAILDKNNVGVSISTDYPETPINYLPLCAGIAEKNGLPHKKALEAITITAAKHCGIDSIVGSLKKGKAADIVLFKEDPLTIAAKPSVVIIDGKIVHNV
ncbi:MAG: amidohydrolase [Oscillospiraceae bacterium]